MILKVGYNVNGRKQVNNNNWVKSHQQVPIAPPPISQSRITGNDKLPNFSNIGSFIPFAGKKSSGDKPSKLDALMFSTNTPSKKLIKILEEEAKDSGYNKITTMHVIKHELIELDEYIDDLNSGKKDFDEERQPVLGSYLTGTLSTNIMSKPELREKIQPVLKEYIKEADKILKKEKPETAEDQDSIPFSQDLTDSVYSLFKETKINDLSPYIIGVGALISPDELTEEFEGSFMDALNDAIMENNKLLSERAPFSGYEQKAKNVLKNLALGTNIFITYDPNKDNVEYFLDTIKKVNDKDPNSKTEIVELNSYATTDYFTDIVSLLARDKDTEYIVALPPFTTIAREGEPEDIAQGKFYVPAKMINTIDKQPPNVHYMFYDSKNSYYTLSNISSFANFEEASIPALSTAQMINAFKENPILMKDIQKNFTKKAIEKTVEASAQMDGVFPDKTQQLMKKIVSYNINKKEINEVDVANYIKEATSLFKKNSDSASFDVVFDTGKKMKDFVGKTATQKEAMIIAKQIKSNKMGTKGIIVYSEDGSPGSGRRFTAKAIAGEARVPYVEMNAMDFGTKEVDLFGEGNISPEASMKKLFSLITAQAEANVHKSAVLFVDNFELFSIGEAVSLYHQKAMAQLLREMDKAQKAGLNILVVGSVSDPGLIGQTAMKSFKFVDKIAVTTPAYSKEERIQVLKYAIKKERIKLSGSKEEQDKIVDYVAEMSDDFPFIYIQNLVKKAGSVAKERGHKLLDKSDFTEAFLQILTGRPANNKMPDFEKRIVASHECGHATNLEVMNSLAKTKGKNWHIPDKVNFITLDPRGMFGGAVFHGNDINPEYTFEKMFGLIVCSFGGNSAENEFYGINGSIGISSDMENVRHKVETMVKVMGLGAKTGKMSIGKADNLSDKMKEMIEDDERVIINNGKIVSDLITEIYSDFNKEFTEKYASRVGTGECIVNGDDFRKALKDWKSRQTPEKQHELELCDNMILKIIDCTKKGIAVGKEEK